MKTFEKEYVLTPLTEICSHGKDQGQPEFRYTELKQCMVFWWRALVKNVDKMKENEADLFGDTNKSSPIKLAPAYSEKAEEDEKNIRFNMKCLCSEEETKTYCALLQVISFLGSMGKGCRKGQGAFYIHEPNITPEQQDIPEADGIPKMKGIPESQTELRNWIVEAIENLAGRKGIKIGASEIRYSDKDLICSKAVAKGSYARLKNIYVGEKMSIETFMNIRESTDEVKEIQRVLKSYLERSPLIILTAYPGDENLNNVYPVLSQFTFVLQKRESSENFEKILENYRNLFENYKERIEDADRNNKQEGGNSGCVRNY